MLAIFVIFISSTWAAMLPTAPNSLIAIQSNDEFLSNSNRTITGKIVNGRPASIEQFPWFVTVRSHTIDGTQSICGGSIISRQWILTAAHCTRGYNSYTIGFGSNELNLPIITMHTKKAIEHRKYNPRLLNYDIALIRLPIQLTYTSTLQAIRLPSRSDAIETNLLFARAKVCGYGRTNDASRSVATRLNSVQMRIISNEQCRRTYGSTVVVPSTICAIGWDSNNQSTCNGDSGGPLVIDAGGIFKQIGIVSFVSNRGCSAGLPAGYVRLTSFLEWISAHTGIVLD